jgi:hypothetical protein
MFFTKIKRKKTALVSQPLEGRTEKEIRHEREIAVHILNEMGYEVNDILFIGLKPLKMLAKTVEAISDVNLVYFTGDWRNSRQCRIEFECCLHYGIEFMME